DLGALGVVDDVVDQRGAVVAAVDQDAVADVVDVVARDRDVLGPVHDPHAAGDRAAPGEGVVGLVGLAEDFQAGDRGAVAGAAHDDPVLAVLGGADARHALAVESDVGRIDHRPGRIDAFAEVDGRAAGHVADQAQGVGDPVVAMGRGVGHGPGVDVEHQFAAGVDLAGAGDAVAADGDVAARDGAADPDIAAGGLEHDDPVGFVRAADLQHARGVDDVADDRRGGGGGQLNPAALGQDRTVVVDHRRIGRQAQLEQAVAGQVEGEGLARAQGEAAAGGGDRPRIGHRRGHEGGQAGVGDGDDGAAQDVDRAAGRAAKAQPIPPGEEAVDVDFGRTGDQAADVDVGGAAEDHPVGVQDGHDAVGVQL